jgi:hypothetical protein
MREAKVVSFVVIARIVQARMRVSKFIGVLDMMATWFLNGGF